MPQIAVLLRRAPSSISRKVRRHTTATVAYDAAVARRQAKQRRRPRKLQSHTAAFLHLVIEIAEADASQGSLVL